MSVKTSFLTRMAWVALLALPLLLVGCGDDGEGGPTGPPSERLSDDEPAPSGDPLALTASSAGVRLYWGEPTLFSGSSSYDIYASFGHAVVMAQIIDERDALTTSPMNVQMNPAPYQAKARVRDLFDEVDDVLASSGGADWSNYVLVIDLFRSSGEWLVRWDGVGIDNYTGAGQYGYWRDDMREESLEIILETVAEASATSHNVSHVVIGDGMERLLLLNPYDYANFVSFYAEARAALKASFPNIKVSAGIHWDRFIGEAALAYAEDGTADTLEWGDVRAAWRDLAEPLYAESDFIALSSEPDPDLYDGRAENLPESHYALLAEVQGARPVVWHTINWPVTSGAAKSNQLDFLERFLALNAGNTVEVVGWKGAVDLDSTACAQLEAVEGPRTDCNAGIFSDSFAPTVLSDFFKELP